MDNFSVIGGLRGVAVRVRNTLTVVEERILGR
jgi:hypothetical protein